MTGQQIAYPLDGSSSTIDVSWSLEQYHWAQTVLIAAGIDHDDTRWQFATTEHGLHPITFMGWWVFVVYYDNRLGLVIHPDRIDRLRNAYPDASIEVCGQTAHGLIWILADPTSVQQHDLETELLLALPLLQSANTIVHRRDDQALILLWNPAKWEWSLFRHQHTYVHAGRAAVERWKIRDPNLVHIGMQAYIYRTGDRGRGFVASGTIVSPPYRTKHFGDADASQFSVDVALDTMLDPENDLLLSLEVMNAQHTEETQVSTFQYSGIVLRDKRATVLERSWRTHVLSIRGTDVTAAITDVNIDEYYYNEGAFRQLSVNVHERSGPARDRAIVIHGTDCCVCGINFERTYGEIGKGFIHIHHLDPIANASEHRPVDPRNDLVPVCPNCHAMLHRRNPPYTIHELVQKMGDGQ